MKHEISRDDLLDFDAYVAIRKDRKRALADLKRNRRMEIGPAATFYFENFDTMLHQVQEMLYIERGGEEQIGDELDAYNPLIPKGSELVATVMFEIDDADRRAALLGRLGGVEETMFLSVAGEKISGVAETDVDRTNAEGKASSVQFIHFPMNAQQASAFKEPGTEVIVGIGHNAYAHMAVMSELVRAALAQDLD